MRLVCPNCGAQYEVDAAVIPDEGREVVCSACGHGWFQPSQRQIDAGEAAPEAVAAPGVAPEEPAEAPAGQPVDKPDTEPDEDEAGHVPAAPAAPEVAPTPPEPEPAEPEPAEPEPAEPAALTAAAAETAPDETPAVPDQPVPEPAGTGGAAAEPPLPPRRTIDDAMMAVLREEAEREARARREEGMSLETQPDLGLDSPPPPPPAEEPALVPAEAAAVAAPAQRKALLPDIEAINSTLTATSERADMAGGPADAESQRRARSGFRAGFSLALLVALVLLFLYMLAPALSARFPSAAPALDGFVGTVDSGRLWLDEMLRRSTQAIRGSEATGG